MSYNIRNIEGGDSLYDDPLNFEYSNRNIYVLNAIKAESPDILGLQEACIKKHAHRDNWLFSGTKELSWFSTLDGTNGLTQNGYTAYRGLSPQGAGSDKQSFNAIYYKTSKFTAVPNSSGTQILTDIDTSITWIVLESKESGQRILVVNTHLPAHWKTTDIENRQIHANALVAKINALNGTNNYPVIITGDFNEKITHPACKIITDAGYANSLSVAKIKVHNVTGTYAKDFTTIAEDAYPIDHIFTKNLPQYAYISYYETVDNKYITGSVGKYPSDHLPVVAYVEFPIIH